MKCLSLHQPWASLVAAGAKRVETRSWAPAHRGPLLIHAAKKWNPDLAEVAVGRPFRAALEAAGVVFEATEAAAMRGWGLPFGAIVGRVDVASCLPTARVGRWENEPTEPDRNYLLDDLGIMGPADGRPYLFVSDDERAFGDYGPGRYAIVLKDPLRFEAPVPFRGSQLLFDVPDELLPEEARS